MACDSIEGWLKAGFESAFPGNDFSNVRALPATDAKFGDFQCNDALAAAKTLHMPPRKIAEAVFARLEAERPAFIAKLELAGPGFLNITVSPDWIAARLAALAADAHAGIPQTGAGQRVVIDYSSPNAAKQMHIGHIRSTVIGNAIDRIYRALGYEVIADNHLGDWGTQFGILIKGYRECLTQEERDNLTVANLEKCYVLSAAKAKEEDGAWKEACKAELVKLQQGDAGNLALWKRFIDISIGEFDRMYAKLGVKFDTYRGESYYNDTMPGVVAKLQEMGLAVESEGALVVNLEAEKLGVAIVRKSDGGYNYTTSDLACVKTRVEEYSPARIIYVTDARQQLHFRQWFSIAAKMGYSGVKLVHVPFGLMSYQGKAISTREGNLIKLDELLAEAVRRALEIVQKRTTTGDAPNPAADQATPAQLSLAEQIGYGAVKYSDLSHDPITDIDFSWDKALALEGNSGPYLQYAYARVCSLLDKAGNPDLSGASFACSEPVEKQLALQLLQFGPTVLRAAECYKPSVLADYLFQTAQLYSSFYQRSPILKSEPAVRDARLRLCALFGTVLSTGLRLLGIDTPSRI
ncbi:MAG: arginine--tRNA ligase [Kiritimatiellae bacterium]|nr:arginine--tRNA ligase [Kiritimatiellia bacterium]